MANSKKPTQVDRKARPKATTPASRENQLIALAHDVAEKQMLEGTASAMVITHYLKLSTEKTKLEAEQLRKDIALKQSRIDSNESSKNIEELYSEAIRAMREYQGQEIYHEDL